MFHVDQEELGHLPDSEVYCCRSDDSELVNVDCYMNGVVCVVDKGSCIHKQRQWKGSINMENIISCGAKPFGFLSRLNR